MTTRSLAVLLVAALLGGCGNAPESTYFPKPFETRLAVPAATDDWVAFGGPEVGIASGDTVEFTGIELVGLKGEATVEGLLLRHSAGGIGAIREADIPAALGYSAAAALVGATVDARTGPAQVIVRVKPLAEGRISASAVRLRFRVNGGSPVAETFPIALAVCATATQPAECPVE